MSDAFDELDAGPYLILLQASTGPGVSLRVWVAIATPNPTPIPIEDAPVPLEGLHRIELTARSPRFELCWDTYLAYCVVNESNALPDGAGSERTSGRLWRTYSRSPFLDFVQRDTFRIEDPPGPLQHHCLACEDHILHVASQGEPRIRRLGPGPPAGPG